MRVLLIHPPYTIGYIGQHRQKMPQYHPPMGLAYIAAYLERHGVEVRILDADPLGLDPEAIIKKASSGYDIVGISALTVTINNAWRMANRLKEFCSETTVVLGGIHPTTLPEESSQQPGVDIVVRGEGEITMLKLVRCLEAGDELSLIKGISFKRDGKVIHNPPRPPLRNLDQLPFPARHLLPNEKYRTLGVMRIPWASIVTSRGCPKKCIFCNPAQGRWWRFRSAENVLEEIEYLIKEYKIRELDIADDNFLLWRKRAEQICDGLIKSGWNLIWRCGNGVRIDTVDRELLVKMHRAGCRWLSFGVESGNQQILNRIKKDITLDEIRNAFKWCREVGIKTTAFMMIGNIGENEATIRETINFAKKLDPDHAQFTIATPYPGTEMYDIIKSQGRFLASDWAAWDLYSEPLFEFENLNSDWLKRMHREAYREFTLRPSYIIHRLLRVRSTAELTGLIKGGLAVLSLVRKR